jgi:hypothetical protein
MRENQDWMFGKLPTGASVSTAYMREDAIVRSAIVSAIPIDVYLQEHVFLGPRAPPPVGVDELSSGRREQPPLWISRDAVDRPPSHGREERLCERVLRAREIMVLHHEER